MTVEYSLRSRGQVPDEPSDLVTSFFGKGAKMMKYQFTRDWFSHNIECWQRWLAEFNGKPRIRALEIGSFEGRSTTWLLENVLTGETSHIDCIDPFRDDYYGRFLSNIQLWRH